MVADGTAAGHAGSGSGLCHHRPMADDRSPADARPAGWVLRERTAHLDVSAMLERFGQVYRYPLGPEADLDAIEAGQRCVLLRTNRSRVVGLWAIGEVVAPVLHLAAGLDHPAAPAADAGLAVDGSVAYLEVELLPLAKPLALDRLADLRLDRSEATLTPLTRDELRAIEAQEFWIDALDDEQQAALDRLLAAEEATDLGDPLG